MSWEALVGNSGESEVSKITRLCKEYERQNKELKESLEHEKLTARSSVESLGEQVKLNTQLHRQLTNLQNTIKYEKVASDGLSKRSLALDVQLTTTKEDNRILTNENTNFRQKLKEYEQALNDERTKRLREMHELEILRRKNAELDAVNSVTQEESIKAHDALLKKLQKLETLAASNERLQDTIDAQAKELIALSRDIFEAKEKHRALTESMVIVEAALSEKTKERDTHEAEVWRLRRELLSLASTPGEKNLAGYSRTPSRAATASSPHGGNAGFSRPSTTSGLVMAHNTSSNALPPPQSAPSISFSTDFWNDDDNSYILPKATKEPLPVVSPIASAHRPYTSAANTFTGVSTSGRFSRSTSAPSFSPTVQSTLGNENDHRDGLLEIQNPNDRARFSSAPISIGKHRPSTSASSHSASAISPLKSPQKSMGSNRSMFVGSGLGLKREEVVVSHGGSAKSVLMKIMADFNANN